MSEQAGIGGPIPSPLPIAGVNPIIPQPVGAQPQPQFQQPQFQQPQFQQPLVMPGPYGN